jgi:hypothetical protein
MLYLLLLYALISFCCCWAGFIFYEILNRFYKSPEHHKRPLIFYLITGLILLTAIGQWLVLFLPLDLTSLVIVLLVLVLLSLPFGKKMSTMGKELKNTLQHQTAFFWGAFSIFLLMILTINAGPTIMDDTDSYHIQMVKWIQEYGTVPGIANLHLRFGFNSSWFTSIALLSPKIKGIDHYLVLNGLLSCWITHYLLQKIFSAFSKKDPLLPVNTIFAGSLVLTIALVIWPLIRGNAATANYDFITTCCIIVLFIESTRIKPFLRSEWIIWPCYLFTVRIINAPLLILALASLIHAYRSPDRRAILLPYLSAWAFLLVPFIIRNTLLSGYPLFPVYQLDPFSFDWKASKPLVIEISEFIKYYNRSNGSPELVYTTSFPAWLKTWYEYLFFYDKLFVGLSLACWLGTLVYWQRRATLHPPQYRIFLLTLLVQLGFWLMIAPDPRFAYGPLLAGIFAFITFLPALASSRLCRPWSTGFLIALTGCILVYTCRKMIVEPSYRNWLLPHRLPVPTTQKIVVDGINLQIPAKVLNNWNPRCYDLDLPCLYKPDPRLRARGKNIKDGFRLDRINDSTDIEGEYKIYKNASN